MPNKSVFSAVITKWVAVSSLVFLCTGSAGTQIGAASYTFIVASGFLCDDSGSCPAAAKSANGESYEISGAGTFDSQGKSIKAAGTFTNKSSNGSVLGTGVWITSELVAFDSYGIAPAALMQKGPAFGSPQIGPKRLPMRSGPLPTGGLAIFRVLLMPMSGASRTAMLQVNCALGDVPPERSVEGIRLSLEKDGTDFSESGWARYVPRG